MTTHRGTALDLYCFICNVYGHSCSYGTSTAQNFTLGTLVMPDHLCPDLLRYEQIGEADNLRGRVVRAFFLVIRLWPIR